MNSAAPPNARLLLFIEYASLGKRIACDLFYTQLTLKAKP